MGGTASKPDSPPKLLKRYSTGSGTKVVEDVAVVAAKVFSERELPRISFEIGVLNTLIKAITFGAAPHYFWLYAMCEFPVLLALVLRKWRKDGMLLYLAEFCWVLNMMGWLYLAIEALHVSPLLSRDTVWVALSLALLAVTAMGATLVPRSTAILATHVVEERKCAAFIVLRCGQLSHPHAPLVLPHRPHLMTHSSL